MTRHFLLTILLVTPAMLRAEDKPLYRIGIPKTLFRDLPPALVVFAGQPFSDLMKSQTGLNAEVVQDSLPMNVAKSIDEGKFQLGVFQGHEFAWARARYSDLAPIVCTVYRPKEVQAFLLVRHDSKATSLSDFKAGKVAIAKTLKDHAHMFFEKRRANELNGGKFAATVETETVHEAIHKVMDRESDVTVADFADWNYFQKLYPGLSQNLKILAKSELFPPTVLAFKKGTLDDTTVNKIRDGFLTAHETSKGARMMRVMRLDRFDRIPADFETSLKSSLTEYPPPTDRK